MRAFVRVVATVATVVHFTFGCCLHAAHFGPANACHECAGHEGDADACCSEREHGYEHGTATVGDGDGASHAGELAVRAGTAAAGHDCAGCTCTASIEDDAAARWAAGAVPFATAVSDAVRPASVAGVERPRDRGGSPPPRDIHPLHERLLV